MEGISQLSRVREDSLRIITSRLLIAAVLEETCLQYERTIEIPLNGGSSMFLYLKIQLVPAERFLVAESR